MQSCVLSSVNINFLLESHQSFQPSEHSSIKCFVQFIVYDSVSPTETIYGEFADWHVPKVMSLGNNLDALVGAQLDNFVCNVKLFEFWL